jgi:hypothetical protein
LLSVPQSLTSEHTGGAVDHWHQHAPERSSRSGPRNDRPGEERAGLRQDAARLLRFAEANRESESSASASLAVRSTLPVAFDREPGRRKSPSDHHLSAAALRAEFGRIREMAALSTLSAPTKEGAQWCAGCGGFIEVLTESRECQRKARYRAAVSHVKLKG